MRVTLDLEDLAAARSSGDGGAAARRDAAGEVGSNISALRLDRVRSVAAALDLRGARVEEALESLARYLDDAALAGLDRVTIIHGLGTGALRDAVRSQAAGHPLVRDQRPGERGEGGDGATIIRL
jgi:dsDNA-specific endonuclease/ATPase MutS2